MIALVILLAQAVDYSDVTYMAAIGDATDSRVLRLSWNDTWDLHADIEGWQGSGVYYDIRISTEPAPYWPEVDSDWYANATPIAGIPDYDADTTLHDLKIDELAPSTKYYIGWRLEMQAGGDTWTTNISTLNSTTCWDPVPPAEPKNLAALPAAESGVLVLTWTAPGDDWNSGTPRRYDIRWSVADPAGFADTAAWFANATAFASSPAPVPAGSLQTFTARGLPGGTQVFIAVRAADEVPNWSEPGNVATVTMPGSAPVIGDGGGGSGGRCSAGPGYSIFFALLIIAMKSLRQPATVSAGP